MGSTNVVTDASGTVVQTLDYYPHGSTRISTNSGGADSARKYIGQFADQSNLDYLQARYYDSSRGQFLTQDPVFVGDPRAQNLADPLSLNAYSYAEDNPITKKDPDRGRTDIPSELRSTRQKGTRICAPLVVIESTNRVTHSKKGCANLRTPVLILASRNNQRGGSDFLDNLSRNCWAELLPCTQNQLRFILPFLHIFEPSREGPELFR
jgi:RHS repeat-associated protein